MEPLSDVRILDLTRVLAGPFATMLMADLGAEVIKIEAPPNGDEARGFPPFLGGLSGYFVSVNRGKKGITLNLKHPEGHGAFLKLVEHADVVCENFRPGVMKRLGLDFETLAEINPRLVYAATSGFGQSGPWSSKPAYDMIVQGMSGIMSITGEPGREPVRVGTSIADLSGALFTVAGILAALHERGRTGKGQMVDVAMLDALVGIMENAVVRYGVAGESPGPMGGRHPSITPFALFESKDGRVVLAIGNDSIWQRFVDAVDVAELRHERFATNADRTANHEALDPILSRLMKSKTTDEWLSLMDPAGVPCGPYHDVGQMVHHPQIQARDMVAQVQQPGAGDFLVTGFPIKFSGHPEHRERPAPDLGEHTEEVLTTLLGYSTERIERLRKDGAI